jgi:hypothetical protein
MHHDLTLTQSNGENGRRCTGCLTVTIKTGKTCCTGLFDTEEVKKRSNKEYYPATAKPVVFLKNITIVRGEQHNEQSSCGVLEGEHTPCHHTTGDMVCGLLPVWHYPG